MRILAAADIHGDHGIYRRLLKAADWHEARALVLAGDLLGYPSGYETVEEAQRADAERILELLESSLIPVFYVMGNDDLVELGSIGDHIQTLHGRRLEIGRYNLVGYQYSLPFMGGIYEKTEEDIGRDLAELEAIADHHTIFVTHSPAKGLLDATVLGTHAGSASILEFVEKACVRAHIHGHIHACFGRSGRHFNVAALPGSRAVMIDLDTMDHLVVDMAGETREGNDGDAGP